MSRNQRLRLPGLATAAELVRRCPVRLAGRAGEGCREDATRDLTGTLLFNKS